MHGTSAGMPVTLSGLGGLVTLAKPETLPEGASPRTYDGDYDVGSWKTRAGLTNYYNQAVSDIGPNLPTVQASSVAPETFPATRPRSCGGIKHRPASASISKLWAFLASQIVTNPAITVVVLQRNRARRGNG